ncbi:hypothetical protein SETIT_1G201300v2 [Setaria italica]|uniref:Uncharacterized protein n=1 Tax=Setaria italica TaxID=4555 RepID=A0A368PM96_SETIT|nr:hypothetical protein SETIT_1G201300v2 [Setaria italica]
MGQRTTNVYELLTINEIVQEPPAHSSLNVQIATVPSITMDAAITPATCKELDKACAIVVEAKIMATTPSVCVQQSALDLPIEQMVLQVATYVEDVVMVEEASENEEAGSVMDLTFGDPVDLVIASDGSTQCGVEAKRPPMEAAFPIDVTATKIEELQIQPRSPSWIAPPCLIDATIEEHLSPRTQRKRKSYDISTLRRNARLAQHNKLRNLGIIGNDGKFDEDVLQAYADYLKEVLPPNLLSLLNRVKGCAFWDLVARISLPLG